MVNGDKGEAMPWTTVIPVIDISVRGLCRRPYPNHPRGCPNYGKRPACPPAAPLLWDYFDRHRPTYVVWNRFPIGEHAQRMWRRHPDWTERQAYCCLYWQPRARKQLAHAIAFCRKGNRPAGLVATVCPEAMGVNVTETMLQCGITLEWPPRQWAYQVALMGTPKNARKETP